jgi:oxygen-independent coproporphyrinogen-3 oxidase
VENFGLDLIAGVPGFAAAVWREALDRAVALAPRHVSVYALTDEEGTRLNGAVARGETALLTDEEQLAALAAAEKVLTAAGYRRYEISNYAKPGFECRHHCACWRGGEYLGLGPAAASHVGLERWTNRPDLAAYLAALEQGRLPPRELDHLTPALKAMERVVFGLRMAEGISAAVAADYVPALRELRKKGLVTFRRRRWSLTARGRELADAVAVELMGFISGRNPEIN